MPKFVEITNIGNTPIDLPLSVLLGKPPKMTRDVRSIATLPKPLDMSDMDLREAALRVLRLPTVADKTFLITIGDRTVTGLVARDQMVGPYQVPVADCAVTTAACILENPELASPSPSPAWRAAPSTSRKSSAAFSVADSPS